MKVKERLESFSEIENQRLIFFFFADEHLLTLYNSNQPLKKSDVYEISNFMLSLQLFLLFFDFMNNHSFYIAQKSKKIIQWSFHHCTEVG